MNLSDRKFERQCLQIQQNDPCLTVLSVRFNRRNLYHKLGQSLIGNTHLKSIAFEQLELTGEAVASSLAAGISQSKLTKLCFYDFLPRHDANEAKGYQILSEGIRSSKTLRQIRLHYIYEKRSDFFLLMLSSMPLLQYITIDNFFEGGNYFIALLSGVVISKPSLKWMSIRMGRLKDVDVLLLARALQHTRSVETLEFHSCHIGDQGVKYLVDHWHPDSPLRCLDLRVNEIGVDGLKLLLRAAQDHRAMRKLILDCNPGIGYEGLKMIGNALPKLAHLTHLLLNYCARLQEHGNLFCRAARKQRNARRQASRALLKGVVNGHVNFEALSIHGNSLSWFVVLRVTRGQW